MQKDVNYHESAVEYNDELAKFADSLAGRLEHPEVQRWCRSVAKQHKFHAGRHQKALRKLQEQEDGSTVETEDGGEDVVIDDERTVHRSAESGQFVTEAEAEENPSTTVEETVEVVSPSSALPVDAAPDAVQDAAPVYGGPTPEPVELTDEEAAEAFAKAQADAEASRKGDAANE